MRVLVNDGELDRWSMNASMATTALDRRRPVSGAAPSVVAMHPVKRLFDIVAAGFGLLVFLPLLLLVMLAIRLETPGQAIFRQRRTGYRGQVFTIYKFRTMTVTEDCDKVRHATKNDERVTEVGALLRKLSIDELPQLWNVLKGDMSIVGPRPHALAHDEYYGALIPTYAARFRARPGLTGYAQVNGFRARDGYIAELNPAGSALVFATYLGGSAGGTAQINDLVLDSSDNIYVSGFTDATNFPTTTGAYQTTDPGLSGNTDEVLFATKVDSSGSSLDFSTYLGSSGTESGGAIALDSSGDVYVAGSTTSAQYPNVNPIQAPLAAPNSGDAVISEFDPTLSTLKFSTNFGGLGDEEAQAIQVDGSGNIYVAGWTTSASGNNMTNGSFTTTTGAFQPANAGGTDLFVAKINPSTTVPPPPPPPPPPPGGGSSSSSGKPYQIIVSTSDIYERPTKPSDYAHDFGSLDTVTIFSYDNLNITSPSGQFEWYKWEASAAGILLCHRNDHVRRPPGNAYLCSRVQNGVLTELSRNTGGTLSTALNQGQAIYVEVKGEALTVDTKSTGTYNLDVALEPN